MGVEPAIFSKDAERSLAACNRGVFLGCCKRLGETICSISVATGVDACLVLFISSLLICNHNNQPANLLYMYRLMRTIIVTPLQCTYYITVTVYKQVTSL